MKIQSKLFLMLFSLNLLLVTGLVFLLQWSIGKGMVEYVNSKEVESLKPLVTELAQVYQKDNNWLTIQGQSRKFDELIFATLKDTVFIPPHTRPPSPPPPPVNNRSEIFTSEDAELLHAPPGRPANYALLDTDNTLIAGRYSDDFEYSINAITVDKITVGFLAVSKRNELTQGYELDFIEQQQSYFWIIALAAISLAALVTQPLARHLVEPIKQIARGMHKLTQGDYRQNIDLHRQDELQELSRDFNELALTLNGNDSARKRWLANISHELRTPVTILRGELEAMLDDVRPLNKKNIASVNEEVKHLQNLIDDLHQLTSADIGGMHYRKKQEDLVALLNAEKDKYSSYLADAGIALEVGIEAPSLTVFADRTRLYQLFENIINNSIKYAQANVVRITLGRDTTFASLAVLKIEDDGEGVGEQHFPHLFEHLYRVDNSRNRKTGGAGIGLSICAHIVAAHQGEITAQQSDLGGLAIIITLPLSE
ncbi:ATP-binding protein [Psychromonas sp.]|uniref:ATP-binding protein n=1 Tax=Psychromonas sp. TaxID=1884585 RepID=UPI0035618C9B